MVKSSTTGTDAEVKKAAAPRAGGPKAAAPKTAAPKGAAAKGAAKARPAPKPAPTEADADTGAAALRKKDFVERVLEAAGAVNKAQAKAVVDHVLAELGAALAKGESLILPPLGKLKVTKRAEKAGAGHVTVKVKTSTGHADKGAKQAAGKAAGKSVGEKDEKSV